MQHGLDAARDVDEVRDVVLDEEKIVAPGEMGDVLDLTGDQIVHNDHLVPLGKQAIT
jgi:hypothetical protein